MLLNKMLETYKKEKAPAGSKKFEFRGKKYYIDGYLASQLNTIIYNINSDWDFVIIVSGDRMVRVGKSVLAMTICAYLSQGLKRAELTDHYNYNMEDVYFDNKVMVEEAQEKPKYSINHYDEAREGLAATKAFTEFQRDLIDFFNECGQLNHIFVVVAPDFFDLKEDIAVGRSECLINVYRRSSQKKVRLFKDTQDKQEVVKYDRGFFEFYNRKKKASLYDKFKSIRRKNYQLVQNNFHGRFINQYPLTESEYREKKADSLRRFVERKKEEKSTIGKKDMAILKVIVKEKMAENKSFRDIAEYIQKKFDYPLEPEGIRGIYRRHIQPYEVSDG